MNIFKVFEFGLTIFILKCLYFFQLLGTFFFVIRWKSLLQISQRLQTCSQMSQLLGTFNFWELFSVIRGKSARPTVSFYQLLKVLVPSFSTFTDLFSNISTFGSFWELFSEFREKSARPTETFYQPLKIIAPNFSTLTDLFSNFSTFGNFCTSSGENQPALL